MCLNLCKYITPSGLGIWVRLVRYNHANPSGLLNMDVKADIQKELAELKEFV